MSTPVITATTQDDLWGAITQLASRIDGLRALRCQPEVTNVAPINAKLDRLETQLAAALRNHQQAAITARS